jgi:hypothetical protein
MKKTIFFLLLISAIVLSIGSCKKSFFEATTNDGSINDATAYKTKADFDAGVVGAYVNLQSAFENIIKLPGFISNDVSNGEGNAVSFDRLFDNTYALTDAKWRELYKIVNNANIVIGKLEGVGPGVLTDVEKDKAMGQVKFLRGFAYLHLAQAFGNIPMPLQAYSLAQNSLSCTPEAEVWTQVIADLTDAAAKLPEAQEWTGADFGRVGKGAALGYLALAHMYKQDWNNAGTASERLFALTKPKYELKADVRDEFSAKNRNLTSSVFEIQYNPKAADKWIGWGGQAPDNGHTWATQTAPPGIGDSWVAFGGWGNYIISPTALSSFEPGDDRRKKLIIKYPDSYKGELMADSFRAANWPKDADFLAKRKEFGYSTKYWHGVSRLPAGENMVMMRFAEVLLNYAEIQFNRGKHADAYDQLNKVRVRAKLAPKAVSTDKEVFMTDLMTERRHETILEAGFWYHLTRTGRAAKFLKDNYNMTMLPQWIHVPIPSRERDVNPNLCTNGY